MKKVLKKLVKVWAWYISLTWIFNGVSRSIVNTVDYCTRKDKGETGEGEGEELIFEWAWYETFRNFKSAWDMIVNN